MIIRNYPQMTLKASSLNNRVVRSTPGMEMRIASTLKESPNYADGAPFQGASAASICPQVLRTLRLLSDNAFSVLVG